MGVLRVLGGWLGVECVVVVCSGGFSNLLFCCVLLDYLFSVGVELCEVLLWLYGVIL